MKSFNKIFTILALTSIWFATGSCYAGTHKWHPETVLMYYAYSDLKELPPPIPYHLILYADGQMFLFREDYKSFLGSPAESYIQILTKKLSRKEICALLNTVDKTGFFDYDPSTYGYSENNQDGLVTEHIQVNSWRSKSVELYGLGFAIEEKFVEYKVDQVMVDTYNIFNNYPIDGFETYQPEKLAVWAVPILGQNDGVYITWPIKSPSLAEISRVRDYYYDPNSAEFSPVPEYYDNTGKSTILEGSAAKEIYDNFDQSIVEWGLPLSENGITYMVLAIPLLPYQSAPPDGEFYAPIPSIEFPKPQSSLSCYPSDGLVEISVP